MHRIQIFITILFLASFGQAAHASSCGFAPIQNINIPNGATASRESIQTAIQIVQQFANETTAHLNCLEAERETMFLNMNKNQQIRWGEDYDAINNALAELQTNLNEQIRIFNAKTQ